MDELTTIGDYEVRVIDRVGAVVRYAATHIVLPRRAVVELLEVDAPRAEAMKLMRRACILEALHHPAVPRVFECGRLDGRPWIATSAGDGPTLEDELRDRRLEVREALTLLEELAAFLSHAHARGVLHGNITPGAIVRAPALGLLRWENARLHDTELMSDAIDGRQDVFDLGKTIASALPTSIPAALKQLLSQLLSPDPELRLTAAEVAIRARELRHPIESIEELDRMLAALDDDADAEIQIEYPPEDTDGGDDFILLERHHMKNVIVDVDAFG